jgi:hypothetical protein
MTHPRGLRPVQRGGLAVLCIVTLAGLAAAVPALAQDPSGAPPASAPAGQPSGDLAGVFPDTVAGVPVSVEVQSGSQWLAAADRATPDGAKVASLTESLLASTGSQPDDLQVATALIEPSPDNRATITALQVAGADAATLVDPAIAMLLGDVQEPELRLRWMAGRDVLRVSDAALPGTYPRTVYPVGDTLWVVEAEGDVLTEILGALPAAPSAAEADPGPELAGVFPYRIADQRRSQLSVISGWSDLLGSAPGAMFDPAHEAEAVQLFLERGIGIGDLSSAYAVWDDDLDIVVLVAAFQIADAQADVMQGILEDVLVPVFSGTAIEPQVTTAQVAGRDVTVFSDGSATDGSGTGDTYYFTVVGDTIWMVNIVAEDETLVDEVFAQLPA